MHRCIGLCVLLALAVSCGPRKPNYANGYDPPEPPAVILDTKRTPGEPTLAAYAKLPFCCYALEHRTGKLRRTNLDGSVQELVIDYGKPWTTKTSPFIGSADRLLIWPLAGRVSPTAVLDKGGNALVPVEGRLVSRNRGCMGEARAASWKPKQDVDVVFADSGKPCPWTLSLTYRLGMLEKGHFHEGLHSISFHRNGKATREVGGSPTVLGVFSPGGALVRTGSDLILWDLASDKCFLVAKADDVAVWPRDLTKPERPRVYATASWKEGVTDLRWAWIMRSPTDIRVRPEYLVQGKRKADPAKR